MRRPSLNAVLALGAAAIVTLVGCGTAIEGKALPGEVAASTSTTSGATSTSSDSASSSTTSTTSSSASETSSEAVPSVESPDAATVTTEPTATPEEPPAEPLPTGEVPPPANPTDELPTDFPSFSSSLPAEWPAAIQLPANSNIYGATSDDGEMTVTFETTGTVDEMIAFFEAEILADGYTETSKSSYGGVFAGSYEKAGSAVDVSILEYDSQVVGSIVVRSS